MHNSAYGYNNVYGGYGIDPSSRYTYSDGTGYTYATDMDAMQAILGQNWWHLRPGDIVKVKLVHIPSGKVIFEKDVGVEG